MGALTDAELEERVLDSIPVELEVFGSGAESANIFRRAGLTASVSPATPDRSLFNSVFAADPRRVVDELDVLERLYERAGVRAWIVWLRGADPIGPGELAPRGFTHDGSPRSMALELSGLREPARPLPVGVELREGDVREAGAINDRAYGLGGGSWASALTRDPDVPMQWAVAVWDGEPVACAGAVDVGDDACVTAVATVPEQKGKGLAGHLIHALLTAAAGRGALTGSLQASRAGAPVYERLGFRDVGFTDLWEKRTGG